MLLKDMLKYRNSWLGVAMIWIVMFHSPGFLFPDFLGFLKSIGYGGVDICLFASGIGCYYSLNKNNDIGQFIKRRFERLMPTYLIFIIFWLIFKFVTTPIPLTAVIGNLLGIEYLTDSGHGFNWYISALLLFYLLSPYFKKVADKLSYKQSLIFTLFLTILSIPFWDSTTYIIIVTRLPIFYMGMILAKASNEGKRLDKKLTAFCLLCFIIGSIFCFVAFKFFSTQLWEKGLYWYPFILLTPGICLLVAYVANISEKIKFLSFIKTVLDTIGKYSFEIYLLHIPLLTILDIAVHKFGLVEYEKLVYVFGLFLLIAGCWVLKKTATFLTKSFKKIK